MAHTLLTTAGCANVGGDARALVAEAEQLDRLGHVLLAPDRETHPAGVGEDVVRPRAPRVDEHVADRAREREVGQASGVAVQVTELSLPEPELDSAEPVRVSRHALPREHLVADALRVHALGRTTGRYAFAVWNAPVQDFGIRVGSFVAPGPYNWGLFKASKHAELCEDLVRWVEDEKRFEEYMKACSGQAGPVYEARARHPYWKTDPNYDGMLQNILRGVWIGYPGPITPAAIEVQAQYILCDMAGRIVVGGLSPEAALKEAHKRVEDIYRIRSRA